MTTVHTQDARAQVLAARAAALARPVGEQRDDDELPLLVLAVGEHRVAVPIDRLREVLPPGPVARLPGSPPEIAGVRSGRGESLTVGLLGALLGLGTDAPVTEQWAAVLDHDTAPVALAADAAQDIVSVRRRDLTVPPHDAHLVAAVTPDGALVLDTEAVLRDPRLFLSPPDPVEEPSWHDA